MSSRRLWVGFAIAATLSVALVALLRARPEVDDSGAPEPSLADVMRSREQVSPPGPGATPPPKPLPSRSDQAGDAIARAKDRLARAEETLDRYRASTKYPPGSRPLTEHPDRARLHDPAEHSQPLDQGSDTRVTVGQDRTFISADETARLWVRCATGSGAPVPCRVNGATASLVPEPGAPPSTRRGPIAFVEADGAWSASFQPSAAGLGDVVGTLRVDVDVTDSKDTGHPFLTLVATGELPATFTRAVSESLVNGSLALGVGIAVKVPGRYVVHGRVDDANGQPVAWLEFNDALAKGAQTVPLIVFGKLIRDLHPAFPLTVRDLEGFLLREDTFPDRQLVPALEGPVHTTARYREEQFSDAEWTSEERNRYLEHLEEEVDHAQADLDHLRP